MILLLMLMLLFSGIAAVVGWLCFGNFAGTLGSFAGALAIGLFLVYRHRQEEKKENQQGNDQNKDT